MAGQPYYNAINGPSYGYAMPAQGYMTPTYQVPQQPAQTPYMIQVDGEMAARAWQMPANLMPGTVIPIWDVDGIHVYFKSVDGYGRLNPTRKARIVFEDETQPLPEGASGSATAVPEGGTAGEIQLALAMDGQIIPLTIGAATPAAAEEYWNVSGVKTVRVAMGCCPSVEIVNASVSPTPATTPAPAISIRNLNVAVNRVA